MSRAGTIRSFLKVNGPSLVREVVAGLGMSPDAASQSLAVMLRGGIVSRTGATHQYRYAFVRDVEERVPMAPELRRERERERERKRHKARRERAAADRAERAKLRKEEAAKIRVMAERVKAERMASQEHVAKDKRDKELAVRRKKDNSLASAQPSAMIGETVSDYVARGGTIEVLPAFAYSRPLRFDHFNDRG